MDALKDIYSLFGPMTARRTKIKVKYDDTDITNDLAPYLKEFSFNDNMSDEADDASLRLEDRNELWCSSWLPDKGASLDLTIVKILSDGSEVTLPLGVFELDEIEISAPPHEVNLKAVSVPNNSGLRGEDHNRSWEKTKLSVIANDLVVTDAQMELFYDTGEDPVLERAEQTEQSDLSFLRKLCKDAGLAIKVSDKKVVIFDEVKYEQAAPVLTLEKSMLISYSIKSATRDVYAACHVKYQKSKNKECIEYTFTLPDKKGKTLQVNEEVASVAEAEKLAKKKLREKNKEEITISITLPGAFIFSAGSTLKLDGFRVFDGKYIITKVAHSIGSGGYTIQADLRKCLNDY